MLSVRGILPCARALTNPPTTSKNLLLERKIKACTAGSAYLRQHNRPLSSDPPDSDQNRIYYGTLATRMRAVKVFSLSTSMAGLAAQPILMEQGMKIGGTGMAVALCSVAGFFTFVTPALLHFITKKYVTEIHYNPKTDEYTATTISILLYKIYTKFKASDVVVPEVPGMFTSFKVGDRALFVDPTLFENTDHYVKIMGYDKPIDFKLNVDEEAVKGANEKSTK